MNTNELLHVIQTLKETGFSHIDLMHEGSHILLSNSAVASHPADLNYYGGHQGMPFHGNVPAFPHLHNQAHVSAQASTAPVVAASSGSTVSAVSSIEEAVQVTSSGAAQSDVIPATPIVEIAGHVIESPIVGTFYSSSNPDSDAFVSVGSMVKKGQVLCIIEAMKLMNEIESDVDGQVVEVLVKNEQGVEYGQPLFKIV